MNSDINFKEIALHDDLTGLKNTRGLFEDCNEKELGEIHFIYIDLANFKNINQILGYAAGDFVLKGIAHKLLDFCGKSEVYRIGGDKFILLTDNHFLCEPSSLQEIFKDPFTHNDIQFMINARIAVLDFGEFPGNPIKDILMLFDFAISNAKINKINKVIEVHKEIQDQFIERKEIEEHIFDGVQRDKFFSRFRPFVDTFTNEIVGFETVSRWTFYNKTVGPEEFLPIAIFTGLIYDIELKMFKETCKYLKELKESKEIKLGSGFKGAVNFTCQTITRIDIDYLVEVIKDNNLKTSEIILELNESFLEEDCAKNKIKQLRKLGFYIILDGYSGNSSSLYNLPEAGVNAIKIDKNTLARIDKNQEYTKIHSVFRFIVNLAKTLDIRVVSDGVLNAKHVTLLKDLGVNIGSGSYYSKPVSKEDFTKLISKKRKGNRLS